MLQLKEMVLALLDESDLDITSGAVEVIVDRVWKYFIHVVFWYAESLT